MCLALNYSKYCIAAIQLLAPGFVSMLLSQQFFTCSPHACVRFLRLPLADYAKLPLRMSSLARDWQWIPLNPHQVKAVTEDH